MYRLLTLEVTEVIKGEYKNKTATLFLVGGELDDDQAQDFAYSQVKDKVDGIDKKKCLKKLYMVEINSCTRYQKNLYEQKNAI